MAAGFMLAPSGSRDPLVPFPPSTSTPVSPPVLTASYTARDIVASCPLNDPAATACVSRALGGVADTGSWASALALLLEVMEAEPGLYAKCHTIAHKLGHMASSELSLEDMVAADPGTCGDGFTHGWVSGSASQGNLDDLVAANSALCESEGSRQRYVSSKQGAFFKGSCSHGLGHAVYQAVPFDFLGGIERCRQLREVGEWEEGKCISGLLMAFGTKEPILSGGTPLDLDGRTVAAACESMDGEAARECWHNTQYFFFGDSRGLAGVCATASNVECDGGLGYLLYQESKFAVKDATAACVPLTAGLALSGCLRGVLYADWRFALQSGEDLDTWRPDCNSLIPAARDLCDSDFATFLSDYKQGDGFDNG